MLVFVLIILLIDIYAFKGIRLIYKSISINWIKILIYSTFWIITSIFVIGIILILLNESFDQSARAQRNLFFFVGLFLTFYIPKILFIVFHFAEDIIKDLKSIKTPKTKFCHEVRIRINGDTKKEINKAVEYLKTFIDKYDGDCTFMIYFVC